MRRRLSCLAVVVAGHALACSDGTPKVSEGVGGDGGAGHAAVAGSVASAGSRAGSTVGGSPSGAAGGGQGGTAGASAGGSGGAGGNGGAGGISTSNGFCGPRPGLAFCEDFEGFASGTLTALPPWAVEVNGEGTVSISDEHHSGARSLRVLGGGFSSFLVYRDAKVLPAQSGRFYLRAFMRLTEAMTAGHNTFIIGDLAASPGTGNALRLGEMHQMLMYTVTGDTHGALANENYYTDHLPGAALVAGTWSCVELLIDSNKPELRVWLDGAEIADLHHTNFPVDPYDALRFGFEKYAGPESEVFYDDLAIGSEPIGCN